MKNPTAHDAPPFRRREWFAGIARAALGVTILDSLPLAALAAPAAGPKVRTIIRLSMGGGMSQLDTFDPKPGREEQGSTGVIRTRVPGTAFAAGLDRLAGLADRLTVLRAVGMQTADHQQAWYWMHTGYPIINTIRHPSLGSWVLNSVDYKGDLPGFVLAGNPNTHPGCGFLDPSLSPVSVADPATGLLNSRRPAELPQPLLDRRLAIAERLDRRFHQTHPDALVDAYDQMYADAVRLLGSSELEAFDVGKEPPAVRERYGESPFGKGCLLARRLTEAGVPMIEVEHTGNWDVHADMYGTERLPKLVSVLDQGMSALIEDLETRGLLSSTLIALTTEFGRTPTINANTGRDHHPAAFSYVLAGAGVKPGMVHGSTDERGGRPDSGAVTIEDFNATIAAAAGLPYDRPFKAPNGRPFKIGAGGTPIREVLA